MATFLLPLAVVLAGSPQESEPAAFVRSPLPRLTREAIQNGRGQELLPVVIELSGPTPDQSRLAAARRLPRWSPADIALREDELVHARQIIEDEVRALHAPVRARIAALGAEVRQSFWIVNAITARVPASRIHALAAVPGVGAIHSEHALAPVAPDDCNYNPLSPPFPGAVAKPDTEPGNPQQFFTWEFGHEDQIGQAAAHANGFRGSYSAGWLPGGEEFASVVIAIADSGFDLETDQWVAGPSQNACWCPPTTVMQDPDCSAGHGIHGEFARYVNDNPGCHLESRASYAEDMIPDDDADSPEALFWDKGLNYTHFAHGTMVSSLAAGSTYTDLNWPECIPCKSSTDDSCPVAGMIGVAPDAELQLYKIGADSFGAISTFDAEMAAIQAAVARGAEVFNLSYQMDPYPNAPVNKALDVAATTHDLVAVVAAGNEGLSQIPDQIQTGYFNGLIVASVGVRDLPPYVLEDVVSHGSSRGPLAWHDRLDDQIDIVSGREGNNICAPGGWWGIVPADEDNPGGFVVAGGDLPCPNESRAVEGQLVISSRVWAVENMVGTSLAAPQVAGAAALVIDALRTHSGAGATITSSGVRAILLNEADDISAVNPPFFDANAYGQGRLNVDGATSFFSHFMTGSAALFEGTVSPTDVRDTHDIYHAHADGTLEATLTWDRVVFPLNGNTDCPDFELILLDANKQKIVTANHAENNFERIEIAGLQPGQYKLRVKARSFVYQAGSTPDVPYAIAFRSRP